MKQSKKLSFIEAVTNTITGLLTSFAIQLVIYPLMGVSVTLQQNIVITAVFFVASICRGYVIRRVFNKIR